MKDPISVIARTSNAAGMAMAYILGGNRFNTAFSSTNGCISKLTSVRLRIEQKRNSYFFYSPKQAPILCSKQIWNQQQEAGSVPAVYLRLPSAQVWWRVSADLHHRCIRFRQASWLKFLVMPSTEVIAECGVWSSRVVSDPWFQTPWFTSWSRGRCEMWECEREERRDEMWR